MGRRLKNYIRLGSHLRVGLESVEPALTNEGAIANAANQQNVSRRVSDVEHLDIWFIYGLRNVLIDLPESNRTDSMRLEI